jgi:hypothetical protein
VLSYVTGGLAYGRVGINGTTTVSGSVAGVGPFSYYYSLRSLSG